MSEETKQNGMSDEELERIAKAICKPNEGGENIILYALRAVRDAERARAGEDTARLDWLFTQGKDWLYWKLERWERLDREIIDAAMSATKGQPSSAAPPTARPERTERIRMKNERGTEGDGGVGSSVLLGDSAKELERKYWGERDVGFELHNGRKIFVRVYREGEDDILTPLSLEKIERATVREKLRELAELVSSLLDTGREGFDAVTSLNQLRFWIENNPGALKDPWKEEK